MNLKLQIQIQRMILLILNINPIVFQTKVNEFVVELSSFGLNQCPGEILLLEIVNKTKIKCQHLKSSHLRIKLIRNCHNYVHPQEIKVSVKMQKKYCNVCIHPLVGSFFLREFQFGYDTILPLYPHF